MTTVNTYKDYLEKTQTLTFEQMADIHQQMVGEIGQDEGLVGHYEKMIKAACTYAGERAAWSTMENEKKDRDRDEYRTSLHNAFIRELNEMTRQLRRRGKSAAWRNVFGDEHEIQKGDKRKMAGDFACYLAFVAEINER